jgi:hypothetical protein
MLSVKLGAVPAFGGIRSRLEAINEGQTIGATSVDPGLNVKVGYPPD